MVKIVIQLISISIQQAIWYVMLFMVCKENQTKILNVNKTVFKLIKHDTHRDATAVSFCYSATMILFRFSIYWYFLKTRTNTVAECWYYFSFLAQKIIHSNTRIGYEIQEFTKVKQKIDTYAIRRPWSNWLNGVVYRHIQHPFSFSNRNFHQHTRLLIMFAVCLCAYVCMNSYGFSMYAKWKSDSHSAFAWEFCSVIHGTGGSMKGKDVRWWNTVRLLWVKQRTTMY